ncbi:MAG TPA: methyltransferase domain-containing protein, partial [Anaerolineales bacterium]|nr:methyltransferase domain-containing protein [Anaerolineales bacterium]
MKMTNHWNQIIYRLWAPIYDSTVNRFFMSGRKRALELLHLQPGERVLIVGVGTGADLPLLPAGVNATGIDLSPDMLAKARLKLPACRATVELIQGDAQVLLMPEDSCDAAILNLILSVVPDSRACLQSTLRAVKPGGRLVVFDKFQPDGEKVTPGRRFMNFFSTRLG